MDEADTRIALICMVQARLCALPVDRVIETVRPLPIDFVADAPYFVRGLAVVRGDPLPVVDVARLLGLEIATPGRFVIVRSGSRRIALAVGSVRGVRAIAPGALHAWPPLLQTAGSGVVEAIGLLDSELLVVLHTARLLPEDVWAQLDLQEAAP